MQNRPNNSHFLICFLSLILAWPLGAHSGHDGDWEKIQTFRERIHDLCSGHGLMHLEDAQLEDILARFADHSRDVALLQDEAPHDNFLVRLTGLIQRSNFTPEQKYAAYRRSYDICLEKLDSGDEWTWTIWFLIRSTDALTPIEIRRHLNSKDPSVRADAKKALEKQPKATQEQDSPENGLRPEGRTSPQAVAGEWDVRNWPLAWLLVGAAIILISGLLLYNLLARK